MKKSGLVSVIRSHGESTTLVLFLPGMSGNNGQWRKVVGLLDELPADLAHGAPVSSHPAFGAGIPTMREIVRGFAGELQGLKYERVIIVAHSIGCFVAMGVARALPELVDGLILINGGLAGIGKFLDRPLHELVTRPRTCLMFVRLCVLVALPTPAALRKKVAGNTRISRALLGGFVSESAIDDDESRTTLLNSTDRPEILPAIWKNRHHWREFQAHAGDVVTDTLFVVGDRDPMSTEQDTRDVAAYLPHARVEVLRGIGHAAPLEAAEIIAGLVRERVVVSSAST